MKWSDLMPGDILKVSKEYEEESMRCSYTCAYLHRVFKIEMDGKYVRVWRVPAVDDYQRYEPLYLKLHNDTGGIVNDFNYNYPAGPFYEIIELEEDKC